MPIPRIWTFTLFPTRNPRLQGTKSAGTKRRFSVTDLIRSILILIGATLVGFVFDAFGLSEANIITVYILGVLVTAVVTTQQAYSLASSVVSIFVFNFFFTKPRFTLNAYDAGYPTTFVVMFLSALITGSLAAKIKQHAKQSAQTAYRTKVLLDTNQLLQQAKEKDSIITVTANQLTKLLGRDIVFYTAEKRRAFGTCPFPRGGTREKGRGNGLRFRE